MTSTPRMRVCDAVSASSGPGYRHPLICAPLCVLLRGKDWAFIVALLATWASFACSVLLTIQVMKVGTISYAMGGWAPPYGIEIRLDALNVFILLIVSGIGSVVAPYARNSLLLEHGRTRLYVLLRVFAVPLWPDGCHRNWRCLQPIRIPRDFIAVVIACSSPLVRTDGR